MRKTRPRMLSLVASVTLLGAGLIVAAPTAAQAANQDIHSNSGPLTDIWISDTLGCQVAYEGDLSYEWYYPGSQETGANCGTRLYVPDGGSGIVFGPASNYEKDQAWTPVSQSAVTGTGVIGDPYQIVTVVEAVDNSGASPVDLGIQITQTDSYITGDTSYQTDVTIANGSESSLSGVIYRLGDCYLQGSDSGYGTHTDSGTVGCRSTQAGGRVEEWIPITSGSHYYESAYYNVVAWPTGENGITPNTRGTNFPNTSDDGTIQDNGTGISWSVDIPNGEQATFSELSSFTSGLSTSKTADDSSVPPDASDGYTITVHNPNSSEVTLNDVTDNLPVGFDYASGSSTDATTNDPIADPAIGGAGNLTWSGSFTAPAGGDFSLHFNVVVASEPGNYSNQAGADAANNYSVAPTGPTAQVHVNSNDLSVTKTDSPDPVTAGDNVGYTIHVTNNGPDPATGVSLDDTVPSDATFVSSSSPGDNWTCSESEGVISCDGPNLSVDESSDVTLVFKTSDPPPAGGTITDSVTVSDNEGGSASDDETTTVVPKNPDQGSGYVPPEGGKVTTGTQTTADDPTNATGKLPPGPGGVVTLDEDPAANNPGFCGGVDCSGNLVIITIPDGYEDPNAPPRLQITYDVTVSSPRARIYVQKDSLPPVRVPRCLEFKIANPSPCVGRRVTLQPSGDQRVNILLLSGDPIFARRR